MNPNFTVHFARASGVFVDLVHKTTKNQKLLTEPAVNNPLNPFTPDLGNHLAEPNLGSRDYLIDTSTSLQLQHITHVDISIVRRQLHVSPSLPPSVLLLHPLPDRLPSPDLPDALTVPTTLRENDELYNPTPTSPRLSNQLPNAFNSANNAQSSESPKLHQYTRPLRARRALHLVRQRALPALRHLNWRRTGILRWC
jgi:hypothetical protein